MQRDNRLSERAGRVVTLAYQISSELGHSYVGSEHLLLAIMQEGNGKAAELLTGAGSVYAELYRLLIDSLGRGEKGQHPAQGFSPDAVRVLQNAAGEAGEQGAALVEPEHMLLAILGDRSSGAAVLLQRQGTDLLKLQRELRDHGERQPGHAQQTTRSTPKKAENKTLEAYTKDLTEAAKQGKLDAVLCRETEIERTLQILCRRRKNNPLLLGEPGVGKTAVVEGIALAILSGKVPEQLRTLRLLSLDLSAMLAGTKYRGDFEERLKNLIEEAGKDENVCLFLDEMHMLIGAGAAEGAIDAASILKPVLSRGELRLIGATTNEEYRKYIEKDAALERRFQTIQVSEPSAGTAEQILHGLRGAYERHHGVKISDDAIREAVALSIRYIPERRLPDKAIDLLDEAAAKLRLHWRDVPDFRCQEMALEAQHSRLEQAVARQEYESAAVLRDEYRAMEQSLADEKQQWLERQSKEAPVLCPADVADAAAEWTGLPLRELEREDRTRLLQLEQRLNTRVIGQKQAVSAAAKSVLRARSGLNDPNRPLCSFLFLGPSGVGKTELCRVLAAELFGDERMLLRLDMSEYMDRQSVSRLTGSAPGYVGYGEGGILTERLRQHPYSVVLMDEVEKADPQVLNLLLQILEEGELTDSMGRKASFRNAVVILTGNIGAENAAEIGKLGFCPGRHKPDPEASYRHAMKALQAAFRPELINRLDEILVFNPLERESLLRIAQMLVGKTEEKLRKQRICLSVSEQVLVLLLPAESESGSGARPVRKRIRQELEEPIAQLLIEGRLLPGSQLRCEATEGKIAFQISESTETSEKNSPILQK